MALQPQDQNNYGISLTTTFLFDVDDIQELEIKPEFKETLIRLYMNLNRMLLALNKKENGYYPLNQILSGQQFFPNPSASYLEQSNYREVFRLVINFGALPNATTKSVPHNIAINAGVSFTHIYGTATDPVNFNYIPLPYASPTLIDNIELKVDATNVTVITGINRTAFTETYIVLDFMKY